MTVLSATNSRQNIEVVKHLCTNHYKDMPLFASLTTAQAILESGLRQAPPSSLALKYNNLFGIKGTGTGIIVNGILKTFVSLPTHEFYRGEMREISQLFAVNSTIEESIAQHSKILSLPRYANLKTAKTFEEIAKFIYEDGYATDPGYPQELIAVYNMYVR